MVLVRRGERSRSVTTMNRQTARLRRWASCRIVGQDPIEFVSGGDAELGEDLAEVVLDRAGADKQRGADLGVGEAVEGKLCDLGFLRGEGAKRLCRLLLDNPAGDRQFG